MIMNSKDGAASDLPCDIVALILLWLPVRSLCRFKCVSKPWLLLISSTSFAKKHINCNNRTPKQLPEQLFYISNQYDCYSLDVESLDSPARRLEFQDEQNAIRFSLISNSCDGLILLLDLYLSWVLANPSTGECRKLPQSPFLMDSQSYMFCYGLGYDSSSDDYKVVRISSDGYDYDFEPEKTIVSVYSLRSNSWRRIKSSPHRFLLIPTCNGVFVNGVLHWLSVSDIMSFHLASESFSTVPLPSSAVEIQVLDVIGDCLCGFEYNMSLCVPFNFWVMKDYGVRDSWVKFTIDYTPSPVNWVLPSRTGKLLVYTDKKVAFYDLKEGTFEELIVRDVPVTAAVLYEESLIRLQ